MKELLKLNKHIITERRNNLYYNKYTKKVNFLLAGVNGRYGVWKSFDFFYNLYKETLKPQELENLRSVYDFKIKYGKQITVRAENNYISVFYNDDNIIADLIKLKLYFTYYVADVVPNTIVFNKTPKHKYRIYLKGGMYNTDERNELYTFLKNHVIDRDKSISTGLQFFYKYDFGKRNYVFFHDKLKIDYNDESFLTLFKLIVPQFFGKHFLLSTKS